MALKARTGWKSAATIVQGWSIWNITIVVEGGSWYSNS